MTGSGSRDGSAYTGTTSGDIAETADGPPRFLVRSGNPTESELAAVTAVLTAMVNEAGNQRMLAADPIRSAWSHSQRNFRDEIRPGPGAWNRTIL